MESHDTTKVSRGWKLFIFLPRLLLHKPARGGKVPKKMLLERFTQFAEGRWLNLLRESVEVSTEAAQLRHRRRRTGNTVERRVARAETLISLGEISAARFALEGSPIAPGSDETLSALTNESRRLPEPRVCKVVQLVETDFGQSDFGHPYPTDFGQTDFGQTDFGHR